MRKYFIPGCIERGLHLDLRVRPPAPAASGNLGCYKTHFVWEFETWDPDISVTLFKTPFVLGNLKTVTRTFSQNRIFQNFMIRPFRIGSYSDKRLRDVPESKDAERNFILLLPGC